ncbi:WhiB family transcriptional regulator [Streptomyces sp. UC4497]
MLAALLALVLPDSNAWRDLAACRGEDPEVMFPDSNEAGIAYAKRVCAGCPVQQQCLQDAMRIEGARSKDMRWGIFGGLTPRQRHRRYTRLRVSGRLP